MTQPIKIGINGFGRIGRKIARLASNDSRVEIAGINDPGSLDAIAHLLKYDSVHGRLDAEVRTEGSKLLLNGKAIPVSAKLDPAQIPWADWGVPIALECTGRFTTGADAKKHIQAGAKKVIISAPGKEIDHTICMGVNHETYDASKHQIVSNASCTTNCLSPVVKVLDENFGVVRGTMTTIHSYTNDQKILDLPHKDLRRARAAAVSQIPTTTGAAKAVGLVLPHLKGKLDGFSVRVPTPNVSLVDFTVELKKNTSAEEINAAMKAASTSSLKGILGYSEEELVSTDYNGDTHSSYVDSFLTSVIEGNLAKVVSWYDNESGFSARMLDLSEWIAKKGL